MKFLSRAALVVAVAGGAAAALVALFQATGDPHPDKAGAMADPREASAAAAPVAEAPPAAAEAPAPIGLAAPGAANLPGLEGPRDEVVFDLAPPLDIVDAVTLRHEDRYLRLAGLEGPGRDEVCHDETRRLWACGLQARAMLHNLTREEGLRCAASLLIDGEPIPVACASRGSDLAQELVRSGFARPLGDAEPLRADLEEAMRERRGLWNGGWSIRGL